MRGRLPRGAIPLREERVADHLVEQTRADIAIPLVAVGSGRDFAQIEPDDRVLLRHDLEQGRDVLQRRSARHRRTGMRTLGRVQSIDVEGEVDFRRKRVGDVRAEAHPGTAFGPCSDDLVLQERIHDPTARLPDHLRLLLAEVANADGNDGGDARKALDHVVHDRSVRPGESLERFPQIRVRVEMQDAHARIALGVRPDGSERDRMIPADHADQPAFLEELLGAAVGETVERFAGRVDPLECSLQGLGVPDVSAALEDRERVRTRDPIEFDESPRRRNQVDPGLVGVAHHRIVEIHLHARIVDGLRALVRRASVRGRGVPRRADEHDLAFVFPVRESEEAIVGRGLVRIERGLGGRRLFRLLRHETSPFAIT